jgi:outer membrane protein
MPGADLGGVTNRELPDRPPPQIDAVMPVPGGLTAAEVSRRALAVNAPVKQKRAELQIAQEKITQTMYQFFPKLTATASYTYLSPVHSVFPLPAGLVPAGTPPFAIDSIKNNFALGAKISIPLSDYVLRLSDAAASSKAGSQAARYALRAEEMKLDSDARSLYFNWLRARGSAEIASKAVERTRARLVDAKSSFDVGVISKADLLRVEALVANTETTFSRARAMLELTAGQLAIIMQDWHPDYHVGEGIPEPGQIAANEENIDNLVREAHAHRLEIKTADESIKLYHKGASATRAGALPRIDATGDVTLGNPNPRYFPATQDWHTTYSFGVAASWTVFDTFLNSAAARELDANAAAAEGRRIELRALIANEVLSSYLDLRRARENYGQQGVALAAAEEGYRVTTDLFKAGRSTGTDLIESENELLNAKLGEINARIDLTIADISLKHALGRDLPAKDQQAAND